MRGKTIQFNLMSTFLESLKKALEKLEEDILEHRENFIFFAYKGYINYDDMLILLNEELGFEVKETYLNESGYDKMNTVTYKDKEFLISLEKHKDFKDFVTLRFFYGCNPLVREEKTEEKLKEDLDFISKKKLHKFLIEFREECRQERIEKTINLYSCETKVAFSKIIKILDRTKMENVCKNNYRHARLLQYNFEDVRLYISLERCANGKNLVLIDGIYLKDLEEFQNE